MANLIIHDRDEELVYSRRADLGEDGEAIDRELRTLGFRGSRCHWFITEETIGRNWGDPSPRLDCPICGAPQLTVADAPVSH